MSYGRYSDFRHTLEVKISGHQTLRMNSTKLSGYQDISRSFKDQFYHCLSSSKPKTDFCHCGFCSHLLLALAGQLTLVILVKLRELRKWKWEKQDCRKYKIDFCHCFCGHLLLALAGQLILMTSHSAPTLAPAADKKMYATEFLATVRF